MMNSCEQSAMASSSSSSNIITGSGTATTATISNINMNNNNNNNMNNINNNCNSSRLGVMSSLTNMFSFPSPRVKKLLNWKQGDEDDKWAQTAIEVLVKRIQKCKGKDVGRSEMEHLERALAHPDQPSRCVTIPRSMDGRIQVGHRKGLPHVIYCRVWRWPDLQTHHELRAIDTCQYPFNAKLKDICINPFHYQRIDSHILPPILVPRHSEFAPTPLIAYQQQLNEQATRQNTYVPATGFNGNLSPNQSIMSSPVHSTDGSMYSSAGPGSSLSAYEMAGETPSPPPQLQHQHHNHHQQQYYNYNAEAAAGGVDGTTGGGALLTNSSAMAAAEAAVTAMSTDDMTPVSFEEQQHWATIAYFELNVRVGEIYNCFNYEVTVDGFTNPQNNTNRFCLGQLSNVNRNSTIEHTRRHIGKGVQLTYVNGVVYLLNHSDSAVFVQSRNLNHELNFHPSTVCKIPPGNSLIIFNNQSFSKLLCEAVRHGFEVVYDLTKMCTLRISFVKGWGAEYQRQDVTSTPCWIEVHMNGALKWLDNVLSTMGSSLNAISSVS